MSIKKLELSGFKSIDTITLTDMEREPMPAVARRRILAEKKYKKGSIMFSSR